MTKKEFIGVIAEKAGVSKKDTEAVYDALWASIIENLKAGEVNTIKLARLVGHAEYPVVFNGIVLEGDIVAQVAAQ